MLRKDEAIVGINLKFVCNILFVAHARDDPNISYIVFFFCFNFTPNDPPKVQSLARSYMIILVLVLII